MIDSIKLPALSIMYVDDDLHSLDVITTILTKKYPAMQIYSADNIVTGLELFKKHRQNIIITDISFPHLDGIQFATKIKQLNAMTQIIIISGHAEKEYQSSLSRIGIIHYIQKPIKFEQIFIAIDDSISFQESLSTQYHKSNNIL